MHKTEKGTFWKKQYKKKPANLPHRRLRFDGAALIRHLTEGAVSFVLACLSGKMFFFKRV